MGPDGDIENLLPAYQDKGRGAYMRECFGTEAWSRRHSFTIVRNPYDRAVSSWHEVGRGLGFHEFLRMVADRKFDDAFQAWHCIPQWSQIVDESDELVVNDVLHYETIEQDYGRLRRKLGLAPRELPRLNVKRTCHYAEMYGPDEKVLVQRIYGEDLDRLRYGFGD